VFIFGVTRKSQMNEEKVENLNYLIYAFDPNNEMSVSLFINQR
jgi:hypothetical protein